MIIFVNHNDNVIIFIDDFKRISAISPMAR